MGWSKQVERNLEAMRYEKDGNIEKAIKLYEININEEFDGTHPYQRLSEIYLNLEQEEDLNRVLIKAIKVFESSDLEDCQDKSNQLQRFKQTYQNINNTFNKVK